MGEILDINEAENSIPDCAAGVKSVFSAIEAIIARRLPEAHIEADPRHYVFRIKSDSESITVAVKLGCSVLGYKNHNGGWDVLSGVNYVLYAPELKEGIDFRAQFRAIEKEAFLQMWREMGLIRKKMSNTALKRYKLIHGSDSKPNSAIHADILAVQSFKNSGRKHLMVMEYLERFPLLQNVERSPIMKQFE